jgi:hypothetical protein
MRISSITLVQSGSFGVSRNKEDSYVSNLIWDVSMIIDLYSLIILHLWWNKVAKLASYYWLTSFWSRYARTCKSNGLWTTPLRLTLVHARASSWTKAIKDDVSSQLTFHWKRQRCEATQSPCYHSVLFFVSTAMDSPCVRVICMQNMPFGSNNWMHACTCVCLVEVKVTWVGFSFPCSCQEKWINCFCLWGHIYGWFMSVISAELEGLFSAMLLQMPPFQDCSILKL